MNSQGVTAADPTDQTKTHQEQTGTAHTAAHQGVVLPVDPLAGSPKTPSGAYGKYPRNPPGYSRYLNIPYAGEGAIDTHRDQKG